MYINGPDIPGQLDPFEVIDRFGAEALRFYLLRDVTFGADGATSMAAVQARYEGELANELGNLASRTIAMINRYRDGDVPAVELDPDDRRRVRAARGSASASSWTAPSSRRRSTRSGSACDG